MLLRHPFKVYAGLLLIIFSFAFSISAARAATMAEVDPMLTAFIAYADLAIASDSARASCLQHPYASEALGPGIFLPLARETAFSGEHKRTALKQTRFNRLQNAMNKGGEVLLALQRDFIQASALPGVLRAHRLSIGTQQEHAMVSRLFRNLLANRFPVDILWKTLQYSYLLNSIIPAAQRPDLDPHFLVWALDSSEIDSNKASHAELEKLRAKVDWFPHSPDRLLAYARIMQRHGRVEIAREAARRYTITGFWGEQAVENDESLRELLPLSRPKTMNLEEMTPLIKSPEGVSRLAFEVAPPLENSGEGIAPNFAETLSWNGEAFVAPRAQLSCPRDVAKFLVERAITASSAAILPKPRKDYHQVRLFIERPGKSQIQFWSQLGQNRWIMPLFVAVDDRLCVLNDPETEWAMLSVLHRNTFLESIYPKFSTDYTPKQPGRDLSADFIASAGILEFPPEPEFALPGLGAQEEVKPGFRMVYYPPGLEHPVVLERLHGKLKGKFSDPASTFSFHRLVPSTDSSPLPGFAETLQLRKDLQEQLLEIVGRSPHSLHLFPQIEYEMDETFNPEIRQFAGYCIKAGIPAGYSAHLLVKLLRVLDLELPEAGSFPIPWKFRVQYRDPELTFSGYWLDFCKTMFVCEIKSNRAGDAPDCFTELLGHVFGDPAGSDDLQGQVELSDGFFMDAKHCFAMTEATVGALDTVIDRLSREGWQYRRELAKRGKVHSNVTFSPPPGQVYFFVKRNGEPMQLQKTCNLAPAVNSVTRIKVEQD